MVQSVQNPVTFADFIHWLPESSGCRYELHRGAIVEMPKPKGKHSLVAGFTAKKLHTATDLAQLPYAIPREYIVRSADGRSGYEPDVIVLDQAALEVQRFSVGDRIVSPTFPNLDLRTDQVFVTEA